MGHNAISNSTMLSAEYLCNLSLSVEGIHPAEALWDGAKLTKLL
jgi:hypothetical protein